MYYEIATQSFSVVESNTLSVYPDLSCSFSGSTAISYSISNYGSTNVLSWTSIDSSTGRLEIVSPSVNSDTEYYFYITSSVFGVSNPVQKLIKLTVTKWQVLNCHKCSSSSSSTWTTWSSDYTLQSGSWIIASKVSKALSITIISIIGACIWLVIIMSFISPTSSISLWAMINQIQLFFLLFLTRAFIPFDVQNVITGSKFTLNIAPYFNFQDIGLFSSTIGKFEYSLSNRTLELLNIKSDSSIFNISPIIILILIIIPFHLLVLLVYKLMPTDEPQGRWKLVKLLSVKVINKLFIIFTFGVYIRYLLQVNQYILISSVYETYNFDLSNSKKIISLVFAILILLLCLLMIIIVLCLSISSYEISKTSNNKLGEIFNGVQMQRKTKFYVPMLLIRRAAFVIFLNTLVSIQSWILISQLSVIQLWYLIWIFVIRPFEHRKNNIIECLNEVFFFVLLFSLIFLNSEKDWSSTVTDVYMWIVASNTFITFIIIASKLKSIIFIVDSLRTLILSAKNKWYNSESNGKRIYLSFCYLIFYFFCN